MRIKYISGLAPVIGLVSVFLLWQSCGDTVDLGSDLLQNDELAIGFTDTLPLVIATERSDSVQTFYYNANDADNAVLPSVYAVGIMDDPVFGRSTSEFYVQYLINNATPDFTDAVLDSAVVVMSYDTLGIYGDISAPFTLQLHRLTDKLDDTKTYYSNEKLNYEATPAAVLANFIPAPKDSIQVIDTVGTDDTTLLRPHIRFLVSPVLAQEILDADSATFAKNTNFVDFFKGFAVVATQPTGGMLAFNPIWNQSTNDPAKFTIYYHQGSSAKSYDFFVTSTAPRSVHFTKEYATAPVNAYLNDPQLSQEYAFVQGHAGLRTEIELPDLSAFDERSILNYGELEFAIAEFPGDDTVTYKAVRQIVVSEKMADGSLRVIDDYILALSRGILSVFGGSPVDGSQNSVTYKRYRMNISTHLQKVLKGTASRKLVLTVAAPAERANRVVICGPKHPVYPARLKLAFSKY